MQNAGAVTFREDLLVFRSHMPEKMYMSRANVILHEMAHMWFGDLVTMSWWDDLWLNESFAEFMAYLAMVEGTRFTGGWAAFNSEQRLGEEKQKEVQAKIAAEREQVINTWASRVKAAKAEMPDFEDMVGSADVSVSNEVRDAIFESEVGPRVLYHLAENPEIAQKLQGMTLSAALRTIGKLEAQFEVSAKPVVEKSKAPAPISPIRSAANGRDVNLNSDGNFHGSYQAWKAGRLAGRIR